MSIRFSEALRIVRRLKAEGKAPATRRERLAVDLVRIVLLIGEHGRQSKYERMRANVANGLNKNWLSEMSEKYGHCPN